MPLEPKKYWSSTTARHRARHREDSSEKTQPQLASSLEYGKFLWRSDKLVATDEKYLM